ncbi:unnamed protein product [Phytophthora lilii]|uniref:Unnamed protein product n=1 Tax=Phytophthora lilii TaxID=2077276 RepID=A0A9W6U1Q5_9STRA|nr:unnamed protein product [Phytophthora lilii]
MPDTFVMLSGLHGIKVYNSTIASWDASAAITNENHPSMSSLYVARVNTTDGLLPLGLQSPDFPQNLYDIEFCVTNLRELPDDLYTKWHAGANLQFEYSQLEAIPASLTQLAPSMLAVTGNPINELPPEIFEITGLTSLSVSGTDLYELPRNVLNVSPELLVISIMDTDISFFWSWSDALFATLWIAGGSAYCTDLDKIKNGSASNFDVAPSGEYASILMDPSEANWENIANAVYCGPFDRSVYPLVVDDYFLAVSTPPAIATY